MRSRETDARGLPGCAVEVRFGGAGVVTAELDVAVNVITDRLHQRHRRADPPKGSRRVDQPVVFASSGLR